MFGCTRCGKVTPHHAVPEGDYLRWLCDICGTTHHMEKVR